ncbi:DUF3540 domain-containing protein [Paraburkholderia sp. BL21I4N1]|uniref:DUF3540 domain-containing protein n=1 Tax=Paraburkholderia sp. BL21I4N1 TaxID=1938801 RepID=UPI000D41BA59|nr:DUF3540 domain-containing protein [Paraburkholderia sp. BL21I4N1]PQV48783.1 uncharacterized protein DUF3540 [Paraburkholderia sp. BL21I4N1]
MTSTVAELRKPPLAMADETRETAGTVLALLNDDMLLVACSSTRLTCRRAFSCLIAPEIGDRVVVSHVEPQRPHVLAILNRPHGRNACIRVDGDLLLESSGHIHIRAEQGLQLHTSDDLGLRGKRLALDSDEATFIARKASIDCVELEGRAGALRLIGKSLESVFERVVQIAKASFRTVETVDHLRCAHLDYAASEAARLHGKHTVLTAERLAKLDAQQIHLG